MLTSSPADSSLFLIDFRKKYKVVAMWSLSEFRVPLILALSTVKLAFLLVTSQDPETPQHYRSKGSRWAYLFAQRL